MNDEKNTGDTRDVAIAKLQKLLGDSYLEHPVDAVYLDQILKGFRDVDVKPEPRRRWVPINF